MPRNHGTVSGTQGKLLEDDGADAMPPPEVATDDWLRLAFVGLAASRCRSVLERWQTPGAVLEAARQGREGELLATQGITPVTVERLREAATRDLRRAIAAMEAHHIRLILQHDPLYPAPLNSIPDPPLYLFVRGTCAPGDDSAVAIVGTRHATEYGRGVAQKLAAELTQRGITVVSGLARGVDTAAHRGALEAGGRTFAVCGCGLDIVYPSDNRELMAQVAAHGACFSEFAPTVHPEAWHFPARNRIISGLSLGVVVVEAGDKSGALITADFAMEQGREVFAVPGNIYKPQCRGTHGLIKQGATLVDSVDDIITALNSRTLPFATTPAGTPAIGAVAAPSGAAPSSTTLGAAVRGDLTAVENRLYLELDVEPRHVDELAERLQMGAAEINATLVMLELKGAARRLPGSMFTRTV